MRNLRNIALASTALISLASTQALAEGGEFKMWPTPVYKADNGVEFKARGRIFQDFGWGTDTDKTTDYKKNETRAGRLGFEIKTPSKLKLKVEASLVGGAFDFEDLTLSYSGAVNITVGNFKLAPPLEEATSSRYISFMERGSFTDAFSFSRGLGAQVEKGGKNWTVRAGIQKGNINASLTNQPVTIAGRVTYSPEVTDMDVHLGASLRHRKTTGTGADFRYRQRPHNHLAPRFLNTDHIADSDTFFGAEMAVVKGPFSVQAEYGILNANLTTPATGQSDPSFKGGYVSATYFITGESRNYEAKKGEFGAVKVKNPIHEGGIGAVELAARFDTIDLSESNIFGGQQKTFLGGINWYLNQNVRMMFNASRSNVTQATLVSANGADGKNRIDTYGVRLQANW